MFQCKNCGILIEKLRPKFIDLIIESETEMTPNIKEYLCPECDSINYILDIEYCKKCRHSHSFLKDPKTQRIIATGCRGKCLKEGL
jgi:hypothetical protein